MGTVAASVSNALTIPYSELPGFAPPTAAGHAGRLSYGRLEGVDIWLLEGRSHLYEGHAAAATTFPVRVLAQLGVTRLVLTNAAGGLHPGLRVGDIVVLDDGLNLTFANPLIPMLSGTPLAPTGRLFDPELSSWALEAARVAGVPAVPGVYAAVTGPNYETRAEQRMYRRLGADVIGMSTLPEALVAAQSGLRVLGLSTVTNCCRPDAPEPTDGASVVHAAGSAAAGVLAILRGVIRRCTPG